MGQTGLLARVEAARLDALRREHRETRGRHSDDPDTALRCPLCDDRPTWARRMTAKELTR